MDLTKEAIEAMAHGDAIRAASEGGLGAAGAVTLPTGFTLNDLERFQDTRRRARGSMTTSASGSFADYVGAHAEAGAAVFVDAASMSARAVLNLGTPDAPGHADNTATFAPERTAAYSALLKAASSQLSQRDLAEFLEDWPDECSCMRNGAPVALGQAIAAARLVTQESAAKLITSDQALSATRSAFQETKVDAQPGGGSLPSHITFTCEPFLGFEARAFLLRVTVLTGDKAPMFRLHIAKLEQHNQEMGRELAAIVRAACGDKTPVHVGTYKVAP